MTRRLLAVTAAVSLLGATAPLAQQAQQNLPAYNASTLSAGGPNLFRTPNTFETTNAFQTDLHHQELTRQAFIVASPSRVNRAERLAALINAGQCDEALELATVEKDRKMIRKVKQICGL